MLNNSPPSPSELTVSAKSGTVSAGNKPRSASVTVRNLRAYYGRTLALADVSIHFEPGQITALIGPSGCGKSTLIRCLNRMHEIVRGAHADGEVLLEGENIYAPAADPVRVRRRIGMVFQKPN